MSVRIGREAVRADPSRSPAGTPPVRRGNMVIEVLIAAALAALLVRALDLNETARQFPLWVLTITLALLALDIVTELAPPLRRRKMVLEQGVVEAPDELAHAAGEQRSGKDETGACPEFETAAGPEGPPRPAAAVPQRWRQMGELTVIVWLLALGAGMYVFGYRVAVPSFVAVFSVYARVPIRVWLSTVLVFMVVNQYVLYGVFNLR